jgi:hypothetical protein
MTKTIFSQRRNQGSIHRLAAWEIRLRLQYQERIRFVLPANKNQLKMTIKTADLVKVGKVERILFSVTIISLEHVTWKELSQGYDDLYDA